VTSSRHNPAHKARMIIALMFPAFVLMTGSPEAASLAEKPAEREARIGHVIATVADYTAHADVARVEDGRLVCDTGRSRAEVQAEHEKLEARKQTIRKERDQKLALLEERRMHELQAHNRSTETLRIQQDYRRGKISLEELKEAQRRHQQRGREIFVRTQEQKDAVTQGYGRRADEISSKQKALWRANSAGSLTITLLHRPSGRDVTILPLENGEPTPRFVSELNQAIGAFIASCEEAAFAYVAHYYQDAFRYGDSDRPVIGFRYNIANARLSPVPCDTPICRSVMATRGNSADPRENPDLTLAGFINGELEKADSAGDYRNAFAYAQGRRHGIVYKLDPYWDRYDGFDIARRIFEGEFGEYRNAPEFKAFYTGLATLYSRLCEAHVMQWQTFEREYDAYEGTDHNLDGSKTIYTSKQTKTYRIDVRFASHWAQFDSDLTKSVLDQGVFQGFGLVLGLRGEMETFLKNHQCDSATVQQMSENFIRAANGKPSAQQAGLRFAGAEAGSDPPARTGIPPAPFTPVADAQTENEIVNAAVAAFGGGGLFGEDWKTPKMSEEELEREMDRVSGEGQDKLNRAAHDAQQSLDELEDATRDAIQGRAKGRQDLEQRLIEMIRERDQVPTGSQRYEDLQDTIEFMMQQMGLTEEPVVEPAVAITSESRPDDGRGTERQAVTVRRERNRQIDQTTDERIQALIRNQHQRQMEAAERFRQQMMAAASGEERVALQDAYKAQQRAQGDQLRKEIQALRIEANERKGEP